MPSLLPTSRGKASSPYVFAESGYTLHYPISVRDERWKLIMAPNPVDQALMHHGLYQLYDLTTDPGETKDLYALQPKVAKRLREELRTWARSWVTKAYSEPSRQREQVDDEVRKQLKALGYLD